MAHEIKLAARSRSEFGKGASRRLRRAGQVPAVVYGHGADPVHIALPGHDTLLALRTANALLSISVDGGAAQLALPKQVQRAPIRGFLEHVDLIVVTRGEKVTVEVPVVLLNDDAADRVVVIDLQTITLEVEATHIPSQIEIDVADLEIGVTITLGDLPLPEGATFIGEDTDLVLAVSPIAAPSAGEGEGDEAAEDAE